MTCFHPLNAYQSRNRDRDTGKRSIIFNRMKVIDHDAIKLPCGQCVGCRLERSRQWAARCMHEAQMHDQNCFITLTFSPAALAKRSNPMSVDVRDFQLFMKRLRKKYMPKCPYPNNEYFEVERAEWLEENSIRFYHCGEYGEKNGRPHYHACIFGFDFADKTLWKVSNGNRLYTSPSLQELWPYGFSTLGEVTFESAAYVARYILKKVNGQMADDRYYDRDTGEIIKPEYTTMSRRPGIGRGWYEKYKSDVYPHDEVILNGVRCKPPKYYDGLYYLTNPHDFDEIKSVRLTKAELHVDNNTKSRLAVREEVQNARLKLLVRSNV